MGNILVDRDVGKLPANRKNSKINGQSFKKNQRERNIAIGSGNRVLGIQLESGKP